MPKPYVPKELKSCESVWLRTDRVRKSMEAPYTGPFKVFSRNDKYFTIILNNEVKQNVSIDRLKPAKIAVCKNKDVSDMESTIINVQNSEDSNSESITPEIFKKTKTGRKIKWNKDNQYHYY